MSSGITVGIDIGTTSVKALAVDGDGTIVARARVPHDIHAPSVDVFEHDAKQAWVDGPRQALDELAVTDFDGLAVATMVPSFTAVDESGTPYTPGLLYGDHRGRAGRNEADLLNSREFRSMLEWTAKEAPGAHGYWTAPAVAAHALGGVAAVDYGTAFALAPLWDGTWQADKLAEIGITPEQLPIVVGDDKVTGQIRGAANGAGMADAWAEATVAGINSPGDVMVICGTTLIVWCVTGQPAAVPGMWSIPHPLGELSILGGASNAGGMFVNWARRAVGAAAAPVDPGNVPLFVPYLKGERTPVHDISLRASINGLDISHDGGSIMRAAYESSAFVARRLIEISGVAKTRIVASGGGTHDAQWMQALADCTGLPVDLVAVPEGAALGAAWHARVLAGLDAKTDVVRWSKHGRRYEPDPAWAGPCGERYQRWLALAAVEHSLMSDDVYVPVTYEHCAHISGPFFHGTKFVLAPGEELVPGRNSNFHQGRVMNNIYFTALVGTAAWGAELATAVSGMTERGHIYIVEPLGPFEDDPNVTNKKFPGNVTQSYRSRHPLRVIGELSAWEGHEPDVLQGMLDNLARMREQGLDLIED